MYTPRDFAERSLEKLQWFIETFSFGALICPDPSGAPQVAHVPFMLDRHRGPQGTLVSHVARANSIWRLFDGGGPTITVFQGPHGYISPSWYTSCDDVPTWNYTVVHAYGTPRLLGDAELTSALESLVERHERSSQTSWSIDDLPAGSFEKMKSQIVGFEIEISKLEGKFKLGQNRTTEDRHGAIAGLRSRGQHLDNELAQLTADTLRT